MKPLFLSFALLAGLSPAVAQDFTDRMVVGTFDHATSINLPPWVSEAAPLNFESYEELAPTSTGEVYLMETIPKGESFNNWSELYALFAQTGVNGTAELYADQTLGDYSRACAELGMFKSPDNTASKAQIMIYCGKYNDNPSQGEVAFFNIQVVDGMLLKNYYHIRTEAFEVSGSNPTSPLSDAEIQMGFAQVAVLEAYPR
jgi:hypothetical protein